MINKQLFQSRVAPTLLLAGLMLCFGGCDRSERFEVSGLLEWDRVELIAESSEPIIEILAEEGQTLEQRQVILRLDPRRQQAQRDEAEAAKAQAAARLAELKRGPRSELINEAQARLRGANSALETQQAEFQRIQTMVDKKLSSPEALDITRSQRDKARAERDAAKASLEALLTGTTLEELQQAEAALKQAEARLNGLTVNFERMTIRAPQAGQLDVLPYKLGEQPRQGEVVAVMLAGDKPYARVYVPEIHRAFVNHQTQAQVFIDGMDEPFTGKIRMISRDAAFTPFYSLTEADRSRLSYVAEVELLEDHAKTLTSGIPLRVEFYSPDTSE